MTFLKHHNHIREVCRRPLVASLIAAMYQNGYDLPHSKTEIYSQRFDLLLQDWDRVKDTLRRNLVRKNDKMELLTRLAFLLHSQHRREFTREDLDLIWCDAIRSLYPNVSVEDLITELLVTNGVIEKFGLSSYTLGHLSYQEFLTARAVLQLQRERDLLSHYHQKWWREVFIFYAGLRGDISDLLKRMQLLFGLDRNAGLLKDMISEGRFTSPVVVDFVKHVIREKRFILDSEGRESGDEE
jgi:predicted NACHT family NTPase